ncbi:MAG: GNAT family N-acetyltransferase [Acidimicrobiales bacterium]
MTVDVRRAEPYDFAEVLRLVEAFYRVDGHRFDQDFLTPSIVELLSHDDHGTIAIAEDGGRPCGYAIVTWGYSLEGGGVEGLLDEIYAEVPGRGVGGSLLAWAETACRHRGARRLALETERPNEAARRFYRHNGYAADDSIWMSKWVDQAEA